MSIRITDNLQSQLNLPDPKPIMVVKIDGYDTIFGNIEISEYIRIGDDGLEIGDDWVIGGFRALPNQHPWIQFNTGTTTRISQKLDVSRGQGSSVTQMVVSINDSNEEVTELVSPGFILDDIMGRLVTVFLGMTDTSYPDDYNPIFRGIVEKVESGSGFISLFLNNTEEKKRVQIVQKVSVDSAEELHYRSTVFQGVLYRNRSDVVNSVSITFVGGGTAGSEVVTVGGGGYAIQVQIQDGVSVASKVKKAIENHPDASQLVDVEVQDDSNTPQFIGSATLGIQLSLDVEDATNFLEPADSGTLRTYFVIEEELVEYTSKSSNTLLGLVRGQQKNGLGFYHETASRVDQVIRLSGNGIDLALKLMLSRGPTFYVDGLEIKSFVYLTPSQSSPDTIFFEGIDIETDYGVVPEDICTVTGATNAGNNITDAIIIEVGKYDGGSYIVVDQPLILEDTTSAVIQIKSQYNTLPIGLGMRPVEVDVAQHVFIKNTFLSTFSFDLFIKDLSNGKDFIERQIYLPMTCFSVPRKGRSSVAYHVGPLPTYDVVLLDTTTVENPDQLKVQRSLSENFFNKVNYSYDYNPVTEEYDTPKSYVSTDSQTRIPVRDKPLEIPSYGLRSDLEAALLTERAAKRLLKRYQYGAEFIKGIKVKFQSGYKTEIGDIVAVDYADLKLSDYSSGNRSGSLKLMEIINKTMDSKTGEITLDVVNSIFGASDRFGMISPSSMTASGSSAIKLLLKKSWSTKSFQKESLKWSDYVGQKVLVHNEDWSVQWETVIRGFDNNDPQGMSVDALPGSPGENWIIQAPNYPNSIDQSELAFWKQRHCFFSPRVQVVSSFLQTEVEVDPGDIGRFFIGSVIRIHNFDFTEDAPEAVVTAIDTLNNLVSFDTPTGFTISTDHFIDLIGFVDKQQAYRVV